MRYTLHFQICQWSRNLSLEHFTGYLVVCPKARLTKGGLFEAVESRLILAVDLELL